MVLVLAVHAAAAAGHAACVPRDKIRGEVYVREFSRRIEIEAGALEGAVPTAVSRQITVSLPRFMRAM
eukprot:COSAG05_NODE_866_length_6876_cov_11.223255_5_plen_68_part_00